MFGDTTTDGATRRNALMRGATHSGMRARNEKLVLSLIRRDGPLPKAEIAKITGLSAQTVSVIMRALEADDLLEKGEPVRGKVGQPSVPMGLAANGAFFFGLKVGRRRSEMALIDFQGRVRGTCVATHDYPTTDDALAFARRSVAELMEKVPAKYHDRVVGLGIGLPFQIWDWATALNLPADAMADWRERDIRSELAETFPWPVLMANDASAACNAELVFGAKDQPENFLYVFVGYFVGGGLVLGGSLFSGVTGNAGALASVPVPDGAGGAAQLVDVASLSALERAAGGDCSFLWESLEGWTIGEDVLARWISEAAHGLAHAITAGVALCDLDALVIDGWLPENVRERLVQATRDAVDASNLAGIRKPAILPGTVGPEARALGAASLPLADRFLLDAGDQR